MGDKEGLLQYAEQLSGDLVDSFLIEENWVQVCPHPAEPEAPWNELRRRIEQKSAHLLCIIDVAGRSESKEHSGGTSSPDGVRMLERLYVFRVDGQSEDRICLHVKTAERWSERRLEDPIRRRAEEIKAVTVKRLQMRRVRDGSVESRQRQALCPADSTETPRGLRETFLEIAKSDQARDLLAQRDRYGNGENMSDGDAIE
eukprot:760254-Hanusia_phi.AAC.1